MGRKKAAEAYPSPYFVSCICIFYRILNFEIKEKKEKKKRFQPDQNFVGAVLC